MRETVEACISPAEPETGDLHGRSRPFTDKVYSGLAEEIGYKNQAVCVDPTCTREERRSIRGDLQHLVWKLRAHISAGSISYKMARLLKIIDLDGNHGIHLRFKEKNGFLFLLIEKMGNRGKGNVSK